MSKKPNSYDSQCLNALAVARSFIKREAPYYSTIIYGFIPHFVEGLGTLGVTTGMALIIDPKWYVDMKKEVGHIKHLCKDESEAVYKMQAGVLVHEAGHILRGMDRIDNLINSGIDKDIINTGFDIPINDDLKEGGWLLPEWACYSSTFGFKEGLTGEQYVELLLKMEKDNPKKFAAAFGKGKGKNKDGTRQVAGGRCGSCGGNGLGDIEDQVDAEIGRTPAEKESIRKEALQQVREAAHGRGNVPSSLKQLLEDDGKKSCIPWRTRLRQVIRRTTGKIINGQTDFSIRRPSKRSYSRGIIRPGMIDCKPEVMLIEDSSGSMGAEQLLAARAEMKGIFNQLGISDAWFCDVDADVASKPQRIRLKDISTMPVSGRGGTDFRPGIELAQTLVPRPDVLIYLTDGDGAAPRHPPKNMQVVWCIVPTRWGRRPASWGELVIVSDDQDLMEPYEYWEDDEDDS